MKLHIEESSDFEEVDITIKCPSVDKELSKLIEKIRLYGFALLCRKDETTYLIKPSDIFYVESIDDKTYVYCKQEVYCSDLKLYEMEDKLPLNIFIRVRKNCILNMNCINNFKSRLNGKIEACLDNEEKIEISRHYVVGLKTKFTEVEARK
ncbi:MAG: LytTR family DNA-binding domain-containing protein [Oscillospiraceae bacterium]